MTTPEFREHPGYTGLFSTGQAEGAIPNGIRVRKVRTERGDAHPVGTQARVLGSIDISMVPPGGEKFGYFVEWDATPHAAVFVIGSKIEPL